MRSLNEIINDPSTQLIDVRESYEVAEECIDRARNIPMADVPEHMEEIKALKCDVVVFCRSGNRSGSVLQFLQQNGCTNVSNGGGIADVQMQLK